jgi:hypothetical protein
MGTASFRGFRPARAARMSAPTSARRPGLTRQLRVVAALAVLASSLVALGGIAESRPPAPAPGKPGAAGISGSLATMQPVNVPARVARIAEVPGRGGAEAWAIGQMIGYKPGWSRTGAGQVVFLHYLAGQGWMVDGPPVDATGKPINPVLANFAIAPNGEGWAVGGQGTMLHHTPGGGWVQVPLCPEVTCSDLTSISLVGNGASLRGYAVGAQSTVLVLNAGSWTIDAVPVVSTSPIGFAAVAAINPDQALAVSDSSSRSLQMYERTPAGWTRQTTGNALFDNAPAVSNGNANLSAFGSAAAATPDGKVWVSCGLVPDDFLNTLGDPAVGDKVRPFAMLFDPAVPAGQQGRFTSYCPKIYSLTNSVVQVQSLCDQPFPVSPLDLASLSVVGGEVFGGGAGLFHFRNGGWYREPDAAGYLTSISFATPTEGWVATSGNAIGLSSIASSSSFTIGHFTSRPEPSMLARWPNPTTNTLYDVAVSPDGQRALAVGDDDTTMLYRSGIGWDKLTRRVLTDLRGVAWSSNDRAWAVGTHGTITPFDGTTFSEDNASSSATGT